MLVFYFSKWVEIFFCIIVYDSVFPKRIMNRPPFKPFKYFDRIFKIITITKTIYQTSCDF